MEAEEKFSEALCNSGLGPAFTPLISPSVAPTAPALKEQIQSGTAILEADLSAGTIGDALDVHEISLEPTRAHKTSLSNEDKKGRTASRKYQTYLSS